MTDAAHLTTRSLQQHQGDWLRKALEYSGMTNKDMATHLGVTASTVSRWINHHQQADRRTLMLWAMRTGVPITFLESGLIPDDERPTPVTDR